MSIGTNQERLEQNNLKIDEITNIANALSSGSEDIPIKLFKTTDEMQQDTNPKNGDLAVVYEQSMNPVENGNIVTTFYFPDTVILPKSIKPEDGLLLPILPGDTTFEDIEHFSKESFKYEYITTADDSSVEIRISCSSLDKSIRVEYTSEDGINFNRTSEDTSIYCGQHGGVIVQGIKENDLTDLYNLIGVEKYFMQVMICDFQGLYQYKDTAYEIAPTQLTLNDENELLKGLIGYGSKGIVKGTYEAKTVSKVPSNLVKTKNYIEYLDITAQNYEDCWQPTNFNTWFCVPCDMKSQYYVCGISDMGNGIYKRWLMTWDNSNILPCIHIGGMNDTDTGVYLNNKYIKCFKFNDITDVSVLKEGYGKDEIGIECSIEDLPVGTNNDNEYITMCPIDTGYGYIGTNCINIYHTTINDVILWTDMIDTDNVKKDRVAYDNLGNQYTGTLDHSLIFDATMDDGIIYQYADDYKSVKRDTKLCTLLKDKSVLKKYYCFWEGPEHMEGYEHKCYLFTDDEPFTIKRVMSQYSSDYYISLTMNDTTEAYGYNIDNNKDESIRLYLRQLPHVMIFRKEDIDLKLLNYIDLENLEKRDIGDEVRYYLRTKPVEPDMYSVEPPELRIITNLQILDEDNTVLIPEQVSCPITGEQYNEAVDITKQILGEEV